MTLNIYSEYLCSLKANPNFTGVCVVLYSNGRKWFEHNLVNGKNHGKQFSWHENGQKSHELNYVSGFQIGIQFFAGVTYEAKPKGIPIWYILVKETL